MAQSIYFDPASCGFIDPRLGGDELPEGAVAISVRRHAELLDGQARGGMIEAGPDGRPRLRMPDAADRRAALRSAIRTEAQRRCLKISPLWRQINDMRDPGPTAARRFARIDAIRAASAQIEAEAAGLRATDIESFDIRNHPHWPED